MQNPVAIDVGRSSVKLHTKVIFPSSVGDWHKRNLSNVGDYELSINGEQFFIGNLAYEESISPREMSTESKIHPETKALFLCGLAIATENEHPMIFTGVPVNQFNQETKAKMLELLCGEYEIKVNKKTINLKIDDIVICPESGGAFWYALSKNSNLGYGKTRIVDIGSRTINYTTANNKVFNNKDSSTLLYGTIKLKDKRLSKEQFVRRIVSDLSQKWMEYDPDHDNIILSGGGSLILGDLLKTHFKKCEIIDDPVFANVMGFWRMGVERCVKKLIAK